MAGAPLRKRSAEPLGPSSDHTTTPDLSFCDVNSMTFTMDSLASGAEEVWSGCRGSTTVSRSCVASFFSFSMNQDNIVAKLRNLNKMEVQTNSKNTES